MIVRWSGPPEVITWAHERLADLQERELGHSLDAVGPDKPLGGQGFGSPLRAAWVRGVARRRGLRAMMCSGPMGWWVYAWHEPSLEALLEARVDELSALRWPTAPEEFVHTIRHRIATPMTPMFSVIADAYGDKTGPGRVDVLPGIERHLLLDGFKAVAGFEDPTALYFTQAWRP